MANAARAGFSPQCSLITSHESRQDSCFRSVRTSGNSATIVLSLPSRSSPLRTAPTTTSSALHPRTAAQRRRVNSADQSNCSHVRSIPASDRAGAGHRDELRSGMFGQGYGVLEVTRCQRASSFSPPRRSGRVDSATRFRFRQRIRLGNLRSRHWPAAEGANSHSSLPR